jgi:hypothetical protein
MLTPANSKIRLDVADGSVDVLYTLVYEICEVAMPSKFRDGDGAD